MHLNKNALAHIIDEISFSHKLSSGKLIEFTELRFKREAVQTVPIRKELPILFQNVLLRDGQDEISKIDLDKIEAFSLAVECISTTNSQKKIVSRIVLVSDSGQRILDTLVAP